MKTPNGFQSFGDQLAAIRSYERRRSSGRVLELEHNLLLDAHQRAVAAGSSEAVPADGGFLVAPEFQGAIVKRMYEVGQILQRCKEVPIKSSSLKFPQFDESSRANGSRLGGIQVYPVNEADTAIKSKPKFLASEVTAHKFIALLEASDEVDRDATAFGVLATDAFALETTFVLENFIINGTGAGEPLGVMNSGALITVPKQTGQAAASVVKQNVDAMLAQFWARSYNSDGAVWLYNQALLPQLSSLSTIVGTGGSESKLWQWATAADDYDRLAGFPAIMSEYCSAPGTPGDLILADFSRYVVAMRELMRGEISIQVLFLSDQNCYRFVTRVGGQPIDPRPVTPLNGTQVTSPFITLGAR
jgi:HK97 family phage major capsid protein